jgi:NAD(P) transhydrogenase subunit alpha
MLVGVPREIVAGERRVAVTPDALRQLGRAGLEVVIESGAGVAAGFTDAEYERAGATLEPAGRRLLERADVVLKVHGPRERPGGGSEIDDLAEGVVVIGLLRPLDRPETMLPLAHRRLTVFAMELIPRVTRAQSMDALSSQANLAGYRSVLLAAASLPKAFPMMVTAAGTITPARVLVLGAGVAGLQAIATARRLGAVVEAYDVRPAVKEQVESLGARFVELPVVTESAEATGGYARAQSEAEQAEERALLADRVAAADVVITTALVPGRRAPLLVREETVHRMRPGSVIVDLAAELGGNCACTRPDEPVLVHGVTVLGPTNLPSEVPFHASQTYARNVTSFLLHLVKDGRLQLDLEDEITRQTLVTRDGEVVHPAVLERLPAETGHGGSA